MSDTGRPDVVVSISIRTLLLAAGGVALAWALASIGSALLMILVSVFSVAVLSPVATAMQRRLRWSRALCSTMLVLGIVLAIAVVVLVLVRAISDAVSGFSDDLPQILDEGIYRWQVQPLDLTGAARGAPSDWGFFVVARR